MSSRAVWILVGVLAVLHYDFWWWDSRTLVFGFMPIGLLYHALFSCAAAFTWSLAVRFAWPEHVEAWAERAADSAGEQGHEGQKGDA